MHITVCKVKYLEFYNALTPYSVFSVKDIQKRFPDFDKRRLVEWQQKGYLVKVRPFLFNKKDEKWVLLFSKYMEQVSLDN